MNPSVLAFYKLSEIRLTFANWEFIHFANVFFCTSSLSSATKKKHHQYLHFSPKNHPKKFNLSFFSPSRKLHFRRAPTVVTKVATVQRLNLLKFNVD